MRLLKTIFLTYCLLIVTISLSAQNKACMYSHDVSSIENIVMAVLESISGEQGSKRDWDRFRHLFRPTAQLNAVFHNKDSAWVKIHTLDAFINNAGTWYVDNGFHEYSYKNHIDRFGNIAQVFQSYGVKLADGVEIERGINSFQLVYLEERWWIVNLIWDSETEKSKIPKKYIE